MRISHRGDVDPFIVMDVMERARLAEAQGRHIIHMEVGQPGTGAPATALKQLEHDLTKPLGYTVGLGLPELRRAISKHYHKKYQVNVPEDRIIITSGASGAFTLAFTALFDNNDHVGLGVPCYPSYRQILKSLGLNVVDIETTLTSRFQPTPADVAHHDLEGLIVASPANPTGSIIAPQELEALITACHAKNTAFISDEIYHGLSYDADCTTALSYSDDVYVINSFSKYFSMTGWRVGWMVVPQSHVRRIERLAQNLFICPPHASQKLALYAMSCEDENQARISVYAQNRNLVMSALTNIGLTTFSPPDGAFYVYVNVSSYTDDSIAFCQDILEQADVAVTPGVDFDPKYGRYWVRLSYARSTDDIALGLTRLSTFFNQRAKL